MNGTFSSRIGRTARGASYPRHFVKSAAVVATLFFAGTFSGTTDAADDASGSPAKIRWGADREGGGPYIFPNEDDPSKIEGFEVDLAAALGRELGVPTEFVQIEWSTFAFSLSRKDIDLALNGYEYTPERAERSLSSLPYYIYELGLCAHGGEGGLRAWDDLAKPLSGRKPRVGVLEASAADEYVTEKYGESCEVLRYTGSTEALRLVETGQLDATVQDLPILSFYVDRLKRHPSLAIIGEPVAPGFYVAYARPEDGAIIEQFNGALRRIYDSGELRRIYETYGMWNSTQERLPAEWAQWSGGLRTRTRSVWSTVWAELPLLLKAARVTVLLAVISMPLAILIGLLAALARAWDTPLLGNFGSSRGLLPRLASALFTFYIEIVRGTPLAFQLWVVYFILPGILPEGLSLSPFWSGVVALAVNYSAYEAEIIRLGLQTIPRGQMEAALSLGMSRGVAVRRVILPQAVRVVLPATANDFIALFKDTAVCSVIAVEELSKAYSMGAKSTGLFVEMAIIASLLYLMMSYPLSLASAAIERRLKQGGAA
ncbi:MAG: ABC transporter permease subunit [Planctomycetaceae bacterium]